MFATPASLLDRLTGHAAPGDWSRFVDLYTPLLFHWARRLGLQDSDAADLVQDVFLLLWRKVPAFEYDAGRSFHAWMKTLFLNRHRSRRRKREPLAVGESMLEPVVVEADPAEEAEERMYLIRRAFRLIEGEFSGVHQRAFRAYVLEERPADEVARELGLGLGTIYGIKSKILSRLREELGRLVE